mmetsp:Transcript_32687/g.77021  ORF Transcript_32687/g.77021 Transcript_32687/m.77021 type:complete len:321 (+) Transcript_32687:166-1128(+)
MRRLGVRPGLCGGHRWSRFCEQQQQQVGNGCQGSKTRQRQESGSEGPQRLGPGCFSQAPNNPFNRPVVDCQFLANLRTPSYGVELPSEETIGHGPFVCLFVCSFVCVYGQNLAPPLTSFRSTPLSLSRDLFLPFCLPSFTLDPANPGSCLRSVELGRRKLLEKHRRGHSRCRGRGRLLPVLFQPVLSRECFWQEQGVYGLCLPDWGGMLGRWGPLLCSRSPRQLSRFVPGVGVHRIHAPEQRRRRFYRIRRHAVRFVGKRRSNRHGRNRPRCSLPVGGRRERDPEVVHRQEVHGTRRKPRQDQFPGPQRAGLRTVVLPGR